MPRSNIYKSRYLKNSKRNAKTVYHSQESPIYHTGKNLNPYFSQMNETYDSSNEIELINSLQKECISFSGNNCTYILKTNNTVDKIYGESISPLLRHAFQFVGRIEDISNGMFQDNESILDYGIVQTAIINISAPIEIIDKEITKQNVEGRTTPALGDLILVHTTNYLYEIKNINNLNMFIHGKNTIYSFSLMLFNIENEKFDLKSDNETVNNGVNQLNKFMDTFEYPAQDNEELIEETKNNNNSDVLSTWNLRVQ